MPSSMEDDDPDLLCLSLDGTLTADNGAREAGTTGRSWILPFANALYVIPTNRHVSCLQYCSGSPFKHIWSQEYTTQVG